LVPGFYSLRANRGWKRIHRRNKKAALGGGFFVEAAAITLTARSRKRFTQAYSLTIDLQIEN
jgi:hypothetical protein